MADEITLTNLGRAWRITIRGNRGFCGSAEFREREDAVAAVARLSEHLGPFPDETGVIQLGEWADFVLGEDE